LYILCFLCINCVYNYKKNPDICLSLFSTITNRDILASWTGLNQTGLNQTESTGLIQSIDIKNLTVCCVFDFEKA